MANSYAVDISSNSAKVSNGNKNLYFDLGNITDGDFWNNVKSDGGDLRLYHSESRTRLPIDLVYIDSGSTSGELHFYTTHSAASTSTDYTLEWGDGSLTQPDPTGSYGRNAVWQDFEAVLHLTEQGDGTDGEYKDSTGNGHNGTAVNAPTASSANNPFGRNWQNFEQRAGGGDDYITIASSSDFNNQTVNLTFMARREGTSNNDCIAANRNSAQSTEFFQYNYGPGGGGQRVLINDGANNNSFNGTTPPLDTNAWAGFSNTTNITLFYNGNYDQADGGEHQWDTTYPIYIGSYFDFSERGFRGKVGEFRLYIGARTENYLTEEYNNQSDNGNFWTTGAVYTLTEPAVELSPSDLTHSHSLDSTSIEVKYSVSPNDLLHNHQIEQTTVNVKYTIQPNDLAHQHLLEETTVNVSYALDVEDLTHAHSLDETEVSVLYELLVNDLQHNHSIDEVELIPHYILSPEDLQHNHLLEDTSLVLPTVILQPESLSHAHTLDNTTVSVNYSLEVDGVLHTHTIDNVELIPHYILTPEDLQHSHTLDEVVLSLIGEATQVSLEENELLAINLEEQKLYKITLAENKVYTVQLTEEELFNTSTTENEKLNITLTEQETTG